MKQFEVFLNDENGATAIEYGLIAALVSISILTALTAMGDTLSSFFTSITSDIDTATP